MSIWSLQFGKKVINDNIFVQWNFINATKKKIIA